jgi:hypothetical protein
MRLFPRGQCARAWELHKSVQPRSGGMHKSEQGTGNDQEYNNLSC